MERLERVVEAGGCLLKTDRLGGMGPQLASGFMLTFDVGRLLLEVDAAAGKIRSVVVESVEDIPSGMTNTSEDEPWWRVIGAPLARVWAGEIGAQGLRLQFRADEEHPRIVALVPSGSELQATLDPTSRS